MGAVRLLSGAVVVAAVTLGGCASVPREAGFADVAADRFPWEVEQSSAAIGFRLQLPSEIEAPVEVNQPLGELVVEQEGRVLAVVPLVAPQAIAPSGWLDTAQRPKLP